MATRAANKRLTREYATIQANPPPFIIAHPSETNILEWHYILTGPPNTPYANGQYWGTLLFPSTYPFAPPSIRMHTPSGRFQPSTRLCLSISDFHPKSFNPAWEVSTILIGLMSFMTSDEMTTGSLGASDAERKWLAARSRWWNSTGGGSVKIPVKGNTATVKGVGAVKAGDGGVKFRAEWPELDEENWKWMKKHRIEAATGKVLADPEGESSTATSTTCSPEVAALKRGPGGTTGLGDAGRAAREASQSWVRRNKFLVMGLVVIGGHELNYITPILEANQSFVIDLLPIRQLCESAISDSARESIKYPTVALVKVGKPCRYMLDRIDQSKKPLTRHPFAYATLVIAYPVPNTVIVNEAKEA